MQQSVNFNSYQLLANEVIACALKDFRNELLTKDELLALVNDDNSMFMLCARYAGYSKSELMRLINNVTSV